MNIFEQGSGEAVLKYLDADYDIIVPGGYVVCAVSGVKIPLSELKYWNVDTQEPYADARAASVGLGLIEKGT